MLTLSHIKSEKLSGLGRLFLVPYLIGFTQD